MGAIAVISSLCVSQCVDYRRSTISIYGPLALPRPCPGNQQCSFNFLFPEDMVAIKDLVVLFAGVAPVVCQTTAGLYEVLQADPGVEFENIAVRSNGNLLITPTGSNSILEVNPASNDDTQQITPIPGVASLLGITEISSDIFAVAAGNYTRQSSQATGSYSIWAIDVSQSPAAISKIVDLPTARFLNGMTSIPARAGSGANSTILVSDTISGSIIHVDPTTSQSTPLFTDLFNSTTLPLALQPGINGLRYVCETQTLYFTNTVKAAFGSVQLEVDFATAGLPTLTPAGEFNTIASGFPGDDFLVQPDGTAYISANPANTFFKVSPGGVVQTLAGGLASTELVGPTSVAFGRRSDDSDVLYITSTGLATTITNRTSDGGKLYKMSTASLI